MSVVSMGWGGEKGEYAECRGFAGWDTTPYETMMPDTCHHLSVKTHQMHHPSEI